VRTFDTNVIVRIVLGDDPEQAALAATLWRDALASGGIFLPKVVLAELVWVLSAAAKLGRDRIASELRRLIALEGVVIEDVTAVTRAVERFERSAADFADYLILETARDANALPLHSFDRHLAREPGVQHIELGAGAAP
jgi:predicted nucleic-acid-binding protein